MTPPNAMNTSRSLDNGITLLDTGFQRPCMAACYLIEDHHEVAIIETGTKDTVDPILQLLDAKGIAPEHVKYVIVTHVHLDHAGGAGALMQNLPNATLVVHALGARHMASPDKLQAGATAVYGEEEFKKTYGDLIPIPQERMISPNDGECLTLGARKLLFLDTPGHARHHFCIHDSMSNGFFTGDTFGLAYEELTTDKGPFIMPTTTPVQFDPVALKQSLKKLIQHQPKKMYLTHFGVVTNAEVLAGKLEQQIDQLVELTMASESLPGQSRIEELHQKILDSLLIKLKEHGCRLPATEQRKILDTDALLNAQGLDFWRSKCDAR